LSKSDSPSKVQIVRPKTSQSSKTARPKATHATKPAQPNLKPSTTTLRVRPSSSALDLRVDGGGAKKILASAQLPLRETKESSKPSEGILRTRIIRS
jgi:hypothetical protein